MIPRFFLTFRPGAMASTTSSSWEFVFYTAAAVMLFVFNKEAQWLADSLRKSIEDVIGGIKASLLAEPTNIADRDPPMATNSVNSRSASSVIHMDAESSLSSVREEDIDEFEGEDTVIFSLDNSDRVGIDDEHSFAVESSHMRSNESVVKMQKERQEVHDPSPRNASPPIRASSSEDPRAYAEQCPSDDFSADDSDASSIDSRDADATESSQIQQKFQNVVVPLNVLGRRHLLSTEIGSTTTDHENDGDESMQLESIEDVLHERGIERRPSVNLSHIFISSSERRLAQMIREEEDPRAAIKVGLKVRKKVQRHRSFDNGSPRRLSRNASGSGQSFPAQLNILKRHRSLDENTFTGFARTSLYAFEEEQVRDASPRKPVRTLTNDNSLDSIKGVLSSNSGPRKPVRTLTNDGSLDSIMDILSNDIGPRKPVRTLTNDGSLDSIIDILSNDSGPCKPVRTLTNDGSLGSIHDVYFNNSGRRDAVPSISRSSVRSDNEELQRSSRNRADSSSRRISCFSDHGRPTQTEARTRRARLGSFDVAAEATGSRVPARRSSSAALRRRDSCIQLGSNVMPLPFKDTLRRRSSIKQISAAEAMEVATDGNSIKEQHRTRILNRMKSLSASDRQILQRVQSRRSIAMS